MSAARWSCTISRRPLGSTWRIGGGSSSLDGAGAATARVSPDRPAHPLARKTSATMTRNAEPDPRRLPLMEVSCGVGGRAASSDSATTDPALRLPRARGVGIHPVRDQLAPLLDRVLGVSPLPLGRGLDRPTTGPPVHPGSEDLA